MSGESNNGNPNCCSIGAGSACVFVSQLLRMYSGPLGVFRDYDGTNIHAIRRRLQLLFIYFGQLHSYCRTVFHPFAINPLDSDESNYLVSKDPTATDS